MAVTERIVYSDFYTDFDKHPITNRLLRKTNADAVKQSIKNIILTDKGERPFKPNFGGHIRAMLFENITPHTFITMREHIIDTLTTHEPRAEILDVVVGETANPHEIMVTIVFSIVNLREPITLELILNRVR